MDIKSQITVICGHYGCGKTNLTLNLAVEAAEKGERPVTVVDMDIVNPYFRSSEYRDFLKKRGIELIAPVFAGTTLDTPTLPPDIFSIFSKSGRVFIDVGGDDAGIVALGGLHEFIKESGCEVIYVINKYRVLSQQPEEALALLREIEAAGRVKATGLVNNSHLGAETRLDTVLDSLPFAFKTRDITGLPLLYSTAPDFAAGNAELPEGIKIIKRYVRFFWEDEEDNAF